MTDDLTTRIRARAGNTDSNEADDWREAADEIDRLNAELSSMTIQRDTARLTSMNWESGFSAQEARADAADAQIAEALASLPQTFDPQSYVADVHAILSRGSQGAAEPSPYEAMVAARRDAEDDTEPWTDPLPLIDPRGRRYPLVSARPGVDVCAYEPRTKEQYDAEQGN